MTYKIDEIEGIGPAFREKLAAASIGTTDELLARCGSAAGRKQIAAATSIDEGKLLSWANMADLMRLDGVGKQFAELLHAAGVDTCKELQHRKAANLAGSLKQINEAKHLAKSTPSESQVAKWIEAAKSARQVITH